MQFEIVAGSHEPDLPFVIVDRQGCHLDVAGLGQLWDGPTTAKVQWGLRDLQGTEYGRITLKDGTGRNFWERDLTLPYVKAHRVRWAQLAAEHVANQAALARQAEENEAAAVAATYRPTPLEQAAGL